MAIWAYLSYRRLYGHYFNFWIVLFIILVPISAQEDEDPHIELIPGGDKPLVFPEPMQEASIYIYGYFGDFNQTALDLEWAKLLNATNMTI